ncbi:glycosyltransferase family 4 protein [Flavobacteriaceae bacterium]|nr:glycosyltransferase family 4 protein [Flavobacteriaceae bacterium]
MKKLIRITTVPVSLEKLLNGQWEFFKKHYNLTAVSADGQELKKFGKASQIVTFGIPLTRKINFFLDLKALWKLYLFLRKEQPLIVHTLTPKAGLVGMLAAFFAGVPIRLHDVVGLPLMEKTGLKYCLLFCIEKIVYACAHRIYPNSFGLKKYIIDTKISSSKKMKVLANGSSNGVDVSHFSKKHFSAETNIALKEQLNIDTTDFVYLFIGRLVGDKGINELISAFTVLSEKEDKIKLLLVGNYEDDLDPLQKETLLIIKKNPNIISVGYQEEVRPYLAIASCFVFPSYREGFPNVVLEAASMELPCIVSDINGSNEIITDQVNGIVIPKKNTESLTSAMFNIKNDNNLRQLFTTNSRKGIAEKFGKEILYKSLLLEYKELEDDL